MTPIGRITKSIGFRGAVSCLVSIANPERLIQQKFLFVIIDGLPVPFFVEEIELKGEEAIIKFEDVDSETAAKKLTRKELYSEKIRAKKKKEILTWKDLSGYAVIDSSDGEIGTIEDVIEYPMQMIAKCIHEGKEIMFPLNDEIVTEIDDSTKTVFVNLPEGLLSMYL